MEIDLDRVAGELTFRGRAELITLDSARAAEVPERWRGVLNGLSAEQRRRTALAHWHPDFLTMIPRFAQVLQEKLIDVRVFWIDNPKSRRFVLAYLVERNEDGYVCWMAWEPATFGDAPRFWDSFPAPMQKFLRHTHAGFTATDWESYGVMRPSDWETVAEYGGWPGGIPGWMDGYEDGCDTGYRGEKYRRIESTRLVVFAKDAGHLFYCTSPDLEVGQIALVYEGDVDPPKDFGGELDQLLMRRLDV
ncbi:hypothetical protein ACNQVK_00565 [Mycobacterium sp. 134]|uniref:hypothetical protein n=1 Tax=Mycobacterium sp. 134 TaxID=3400425 RepID=UPI003AAB2694